MNKYLSMVLMAKLVQANLPYISKPGGVVQVLQKVTPVVDKDSIITRIPISAVHQPQTGCNLNDDISIQFIPESKHKGMFYFEDNGTSISTVRRTMMNQYRSKMRLVVWLNQKLFKSQYDISFASVAMNQMIGILTSGKLNTDVMKNIEVNIESIPPATANIFGQYDYNESQTQFLLPPYDFFAIDLEINFGIGKECEIPVELDEITLC